MLRKNSTNISSTKLREQLLFGILARKLTKNEVDEQTINLIKQEGIVNFFSYLNLWDKISFYKSYMLGMLSNIFIRLTPKALSTLINELI